MVASERSLSKMESGYFESGLNEKQESVYQQQRQASRMRINPRIVSDATIGLSDGLTVPFALTAGLAALGDTRLVIYAGIAELIAGGISMGLGGYLGAKGEAEAYDSTLAETRSIVLSDPIHARRLVQSTFVGHGISEQTMRDIADQLFVEQSDVVSFLMHFYHRQAEADYTSSKAYLSGLTIALGYFFGGLVPLLPYTLLVDMSEAFMASVVLMVFALFGFGWMKTALLGTGNKTACLKSGLQMVVLGGVASGAAICCVKAVN